MFKSYTPINLSVVNHKEKNDIKQYQTCPPMDPH